MCHGSWLPTQWSPFILILKRLPIALSPKKYGTRITTIVMLGVTAGKPVCKVSAPQHRRATMPAVVQEKFGSRCHATRQVGWHTATPTASNAADCKLTDGRFQELLLCLLQRTMLCNRSRSDPVLLSISLCLSPKRQATAARTTTCISGRLGGQRSFSGAAGEPVELPCRTTRSHAAKMGRIGWPAIPSDHASVDRSPGTGP